LLPEVVLQQSKARSPSKRRVSAPTLCSCDAPSLLCTPARTDVARDAGWHRAWSVWQPSSVGVRKGAMQESGMLMFPVCLRTQDTHFSAVWVTSYQKKWWIFHFSRCLSKDWKRLFGRCILIKWKYGAQCRITVRISPQGHIAHKTKSSRIKLSFMNLKIC